MAEHRYKAYRNPDTKENRELAENFHTSHKEYPFPVVCPVSGSIPAWVSGSLIHLAPAKFEWGNTRYRHLFDGDSLASMFVISNGRVTFQSKYVDSNYHNRNKKYNRISNAGFGHAAPPDPCQYFFSRWFTYFNPFHRQENDNTNVAIIQLADKILLATETPYMNEIDPETLQLVNRINMYDQVGPESGVRLWLAHVQQDVDGSTWLMSTHIPHSYDLVKLKADGTSTIEASLPINGASPYYYHSFAMTENYVVLALNPFYISSMTSFLKVVVLKYTFLDILEWRPESGLQFRIIDRRTLKEVRSCVADAQFIFHHCNAYEKNGELIIDAVCHKDSSIVQQLCMDKLKTGSPNETFYAGNLCRYRIPITELTDDPTAEPYRFPLTAEGFDQQLLAVDLEFPVVNQLHSMKEYTFAYGVNNARNYHSLAKINVCTKEYLTWDAPANCSAQEPHFIASPNAKKEDEGVLISIISSTNESFLLVLDAQTFKEIAHAKVQHRLPPMLHGKFLAKNKNKFPNI